MKISFFSWSAVGIILAAWCLSGCLDKNGLFVDKPDQDIFYYRIIDKSKQNLLGTKQGQINPCDVKITSADKINVNLSCYQFKELAVNVGDAIKLFGDGWSLVLSNANKFEKPILDAHNGRYDFVYYVDLPGGDRDTLVFKTGEINTDTNKPSIYYNGEKSIIFNNLGSATGNVYLIKNNN